MFWSANSFILYFNRVQFVLRVTRWTTFEIYVSDKQLRKHNSSKTMTKHLQNRYGMRNENENKNMATKRMRYRCWSLWRMVCNKKGCCKYILYTTFAPFVQFNDEKAQGSLLAALGSLALFNHQHSGSPRTDSLCLFHSHRICCFFFFLLHHNRKSMLRRHFVRHVNFLVRTNDANRFDERFENQSGKCTSS